eukprot:scaffold52_cov246-Pinguiococcus_pyrenoidosus.AAC.12
MGRKRKLEISFDANARKDYLLGFRKRKLERRRHGLAMQALKDRKELLETRQEVRVLTVVFASLLVPFADATFPWQLRENRRSSRGLDRAAAAARPTEEEVEKNEEEAAPVKVRENFADNFSKEQFGAGVTVTTTLNIDADEEDSDEEVTPAQKRRRSADFGDVWQAFLTLSFALQTLLLRRERVRAVEGLKKAMERKKLYGDSRDDEQRRAHSLATFKQKIKQLPMKKRKNAKARRSTEAVGAHSAGRAKGKGSKKKTKKKK